MYAHGQKYFPTKIFPYIFHIKPFIYNGQKFEDTTGVIRSRKSKMGRQYNGQKKKEKRTDNDLQNITQKTKDRATGTPLKTHKG
jgi:hypothetical protein